MWKGLNKILHDKNDYHLNPELKNEVEISDDLLQATIKYQKYLIPKKIKYFFKYDKSFFVRLFIKLFIRLLFIIFIIGSIIIVSLLAFGININVKKMPKTDYTNFPMYISSTGDLEKDSLNIEKYKKTINKNGQYIIFYLKDPSKNYEKWKNGLHELESGGWENPYEAKRTNSQYWGKYQMGESARKDIGLSNVTWEKWKNTPELQEAALKMWINALYQNLKDDIEKYDNTFLNGWSITESGIIAMAHNVGSEPVRKFLHSNGKNIPKDGSDKDATRFLVLGNYNLELDK
jgi:hypothetical protein